MSVIYWLVDFMYSDFLIHLLRITLTIISAGMIGYERQDKNKRAGIKTHIFVGLGSCLAMLVSKYGFSDAISFDASRIGASILSGIGFLCAGVIFTNPEGVLTGLTTAAGLWTTSAIGMAFGSGMISVGIITTGVVFGIQYLVSFTNVQLGPERARQFNIYLQSKDLELLRDIYLDLKDNGALTLYRTISQNNEDHIFSMTLHLDIPSNISLDKVFEILQGRDKLISFDIESYMKG